jgi:hypothetical protein
VLDEHAPGVFGFVSTELGEEAGTDLHDGCFVDDGTGFCIDVEEVEGLCWVVEEFEDVDVV